MNKNFKTWFRMLMSQDKKTSTLALDQLKDYLFYPYEKSNEQIGAFRSISISRHAYSGSYLIIKLVVLGGAELPEFIDKYFNLDVSKKQIITASFDTDSSCTIEVLIHDEV